MIFKKIFAIAIINVPETVNFDPSLPSELKNQAYIPYHVTRIAANANASISGSFIG